MQSERLPSDRVRDSARFVATELIRQPVKQAVHEALREEATAQAEADRSTVEMERTTDSEDASGRSRRFWGGLVLSLAGVVYLARRRMQSSWDGQPTGPGETGYASEGEVQTGETAGEDVSPTGDSGTSPTTEG